MEDPKDPEHPNGSLRTEGTREKKRSHQILTAGPKPGSDPTQGALLGVNLFAHTGQWTRITGADDKGLTGSL